MLILCIYLTVSIVSYGICLIVCLKDEESPQSEHLRNLKDNGYSNTYICAEVLIGALIGIVTLIPSVVYIFFIEKDDEEP